ncbi:hypothetical protein BT96DRAFT_1015348 [Gymnopus androsaceus JB14]|uniref:Nephrocystin 3-like N-terminal domain-containing protein n=1 Tax=Gymnopus androsaceus JB14 TaxID=1447944 RepID=A0A6A4I5P4_9AGAR|nr:hypothetical protein BT96DRAFT_1015348 [Gymnopus androsaceus JB14]
MTIFPNAHNFTINNGSFPNVAGDLNYNFHGKGEEQDYTGLKILYKNAVRGAFYNSEQRFPPPNCHVGTRTQVLEILTSWITDVADSTSIYWLYGAAGVGKSAVAQTISEKFAASHLAATFFFARADPSRNNLNSFLITISYQLATSPALGPLLNYPIGLAVRENPSIVHAVLEEQFRDLIVLPCIWLTTTCRLTTEQWKDLPRLIVIDGLDECIDIASQERLLSIIRQAKTATPPLPFEFLICSRPEPRIRNAFSHQDFHRILDCTDIGESFESGKDIANYLKHEFSRVRREHGRSMAHTAEDWPGNGIIQQLVQKACGQFIYAATVIKYVGDYDGFPVERLEIILKITVPDDFDSPYPDLDLLYMQILSVCPKTKLFFDVIAHIMRPDDTFFDKFYERTSAFVLEGLFFLPKGKIWALLSRLHSVLLIPENDHDNITIRHASFIDFLTDQRRSGKYCVNTGTQARHERALFYLLTRILNSIINHDGTTCICAHSGFDDYAYTYWSAHLKNIKESSRRILTALNRVDLCGLLNTNLQCRNLNSSLKDSIDTLQSCLNNFQSVVQWAHGLRQSSHRLPILDILIKQYGLFDFGFSISIPSSLITQAKKILMVAGFMIKTHLILYRLSREVLDRADRLQLQMIHSLLTRLPDPPQLDLPSILDSLWPEYLSISSLNMNPPQFDDDDLWNKSGPDIFTKIPVNYVECHKEIGLHCIWILSRIPYHNDVTVHYAKLQWINHILNAHPSDEIWQVLLDNMVLLNKEDARRALEWAEGAKESQNELAQQLIMRIRSHLEPRPVKVASDGSQSRRGTDSKSVNGRASQKVKHRWMKKLCCS